MTNSLALRNKKKGERLKKLRLKAMLHEKMLAVICDTSPATICRIEKGVANFHSRSAEAVCSVFGIYPETILTAAIDSMDEASVGERVNQYLKANKVTREIRQSVEESRSRFKTLSYRIDQLIDQQFFKDYRKVAQVKAALFEKYQLDIASSVISQGLKAKKYFTVKNAERGQHKLYKWAGK